MKEMEKTWPHLYFGNFPSFVTILDYKEPGGKLRPELTDKNIPRISRDYTNNIKAGLYEMQFITNHLSKKYKQEILDSNELTSFFEELFEVGSWSNPTGIDKYPIASNLFNIAVKILIENAPVRLQRKLASLLVEFIDLYNLPLDLGRKGSVSLIDPTTRQDATFDDVINELLDQAKKRRR